MNAIRPRSAGRLFRLAALLAFAGLAGPGCMNLTLTRSRQGIPIDADAVARVRPGATTLPELLEILGAPQEVHAHTDGRVLVWRCRARNTSSFSVDAGGAALYFIDVTQIVSSILGMLSFTLDRIHQDEDRVVVLVGPDGIVRGIGVRLKTGDLPWL